MNAMRGTAWRCHARPASKGGATCGHLNVPDVELMHRGQECCTECGCTRIAGTDRYKRQAGVLGRLWIVKYEARERGQNQRFRPVRITVVASGPDEAYAEARNELDEAFLLGYPIEASPVVAP